MKWLRRCFQSQGTHRCAYIEAGLIRFEVRKDHRRLALCTEPTLARGFSMRENPISLRQNRAYAGAIGGYHPHVTA
jgi:hypothetical protein